MFSKIASECNGVTITELHNVRDTFAQFAIAWEGEDTLDEVFASLADQLDDTLRARLIFQLLTATSDDDAMLSSIDKRFALNFAEVIGPDWAQWLYRFTVLCTKLA